MQVEAHREAAKLRCPLFTPDQLLIVPRFKYPVAQHDIMFTTDLLLNICRFEYPVSQHEIPKRQLWISVKNEIGFMSRTETAMGQALLDLSTLDLTKAVTEWLVVSFVSFCLCNSVHSVFLFLSALSHALTLALLIQEC